MNYRNDPQEIEKKSFEIIASELGVHFSDSRVEAIVKRVIHTTADFEYAKLLEFSPTAIEEGIKALKEGGSIYCDTNMIVAGVNKKSFNRFGGHLYNFVHEEEVCVEAKKRGVTRSIIAIEKALEKKDIKIFAIGNAPTALYTLLEKCKEGYPKPNLIIGVPVGFVGAAESKEELKKHDIPYILTSGRKGGSTVAVAIINALEKCI
ncbi:precorrin-8X methylmutase [Garciella nitratireducens]|uniref:Precorrin-8X methylmutase n=1 Tax=Garciella nitratireducens DSM 15102 TaxID=1121911 RepID=A0A1T4KIB0_9FIRM|nr:precorrin-8X methylmutase [Garciella nitratireducens]RBP41556.1 precorrin-8X methylmutase [Garciella nitratireducens]SJZ42159.1 precorrin-8X methylmutase [Garciella nitratireducens DSM 15102]